MKSWAAIFGVILLAGCSGDSTAVSSGPGQTTAPRAGATAVWRIDEASPPEAGASSFAALVSRLECSSGETGELRTPTVSIEEDRVVVIFEAEPLPPGDYNCPGNDEVEREVRVGVPIGGRQIVDGACLSGEAVSTSFCDDGPVRWTPPNQPAPAMNGAPPDDAGEGVACTDDALVDENGQTYGRDPAQNCAFVDDDGNVVPDR